MITIIPIEPLNEAHGVLIVAAFSKHFINCANRDHGDGDGNGDGYGYSYSFGRGYGDGYGDGRGYGVGNVPEEWLIDEISMKPTGG